MATKRHEEAQKVRRPGLLFCDFLCLFVAILVRLSPHAPPPRRDDPPRPGRPGRAHAPAVARGPRVVRVSARPDGRRVLYVRNFESLMPVSEQHADWRAVDVGGRNDVLIASHYWVSSGYRYGPPQWVPNGRRVAATRQAISPRFAMRIFVNMVLVTSGRGRTSSRGSAC